MKRLAQFFLAVLFLTVSSISLATCPEGAKQTYKGCEPDLDFVRVLGIEKQLAFCLQEVVVGSAGTKYIDMPEHKAMAVNGNDATFSTSESTQNNAKKNAFSRCANAYGSGCAISDVNGIQCRNAVAEKKKAIEADRERKEEAERAVEAERKRKEEQKEKAAEAERKRLEEEARKRAEAAEAERKRLEAEKKRQEEAEKRKTYVLNNRKNAPLVEIEKFLLDYQSLLDRSSIKDIVNEYFVRSRDQAIGDSGNIFRALSDVFSRAERIGVDLSPIDDTGVQFVVIDRADQQNSDDFSVEIKNGEQRDPVLDKFASVASPTFTGYCYRPENDFYLFVSGASSCHRVTDINIYSEAFYARSILSSIEALSPSDYSNSAVHFRPVRVNFQQAIDSFKEKDIEYMVILNVVSGLSDREIVGHETVESEYEAGTQRIPNDAYEIARYNVGKTKELHETELYNTRRCMQGAGLLKAQMCKKRYLEKLESTYATWQNAERRFKNTPSTLIEPIYSSYSFEKSTLNIQKNVLLDIYILDKNKRQIYVVPVSKSGEKVEYTLIHGLSDKDRRYGFFSGSAASDELISAYEELPVEIGLSELFDKFSITSPSAKTFPDLDSLEKHIFEPSTAAIDDDISKKKAVADVVSTDDEYNSRFESVVVVLHPGGGIGSGFYVTEDMVLTNYHVTEGTSFLELAMFSGEETFGKVIAKDIRLDLALIKVQARGKPVTFYKEKILNLGSTVEAIGHPSGLEFSITRGAVSGIRRLPSKYDPGGKAIRFIQTDVAINPGNSGGPLYLDDKVVGVNTMKLVSEDIEGLNFAVHYSEVARFLEKNGIK